MSQPLFPFPEEGALVAMMKAKDVSKKLEESPLIKIAGLVSTLRFTSCSIARDDEMLELYTAIADKLSAKKVDLTIHGGTRVLATYASKKSITAIPFGRDEGDDDWGHYVYVITRYGAAKVLEKKDASQSKK